MRPRRGGVVAGVFGFVSERAVRLALTAVIGIFVARYLGPEGFGLLSYAGGVFGLLAPLTLLGMPEVLVREFSTQDDWRPTFASALARQIPVALAAAVVGFLIVAISRDFERDAVLLAAVLFPVPLLGLSATLRSYLEAAGRVRQIVTVGLFAGVLASALKLAGVFSEAPIWLFGAFGAIEGAAVALGLALAIPGSKGVRAVARHYRPDVARRLLKESWPLLLSAIAVTVYMRADILMLGIISGDRETGVYTAAARLSEVWYFIPMSAIAAIRPRLARMYAAGEGMRYRVATQRFMTTAMAASLLVVGATLFGGDLVIGWLYGIEFVGAGPVLRIHILAAPFVFLGVAGSQWFIDRGMTRAVMVRSTAGAIINVALNILLIPNFGAIGASVATLVAYTSGVLINVVPRSTRPLFWMQLRALLLHWPQSPDPHSMS